MLFSRGTRCILDSSLSVSQIQPWWSSSPIYGQQAIPTQIVLMKQDRDHNFRSRNNVTWRSKFQKGVWKRIYSYDGICMKPKSQSITWINLLSNSFLYKNLHPLIAETNIRSGYQSLWSVGVLVWWSEIKEIRVANYHF